MENEILEFLNARIRDEHGDRVALDDDWVDAHLDSFGTTMVLADMDGEYGCFPREWFSTVQWQDELDADNNILAKGLTIRDIVERVVNESPKLQIPQT